MGRLSRVLTALAAAGVGTVVVAVLGLAPAHGDDGQSSVYGPVVSGCTLTDPRVGEISGALVTRDGRLLVANDKALQLWSLDADCRVRLVWDGEPVVRGGVRDAEVDVEDLAQGPDGTVWLADTGGNRLDRRIVHLVGVTHDQEVLDVPLLMPRKGIDVEAAVVTSDFELILLSKESSGPAKVFTAPLPPVASAVPVVVDEVGSVDLAGIADRAGSVSSLVTGAALSPAGDHLALRTYTDVYEVDLEGRSVVQALTTAPPRWVGAVSQPQGESVSYAAGGDRLVMLSETLSSTVDTIALARAIDSTGTAAPRPWWLLGLAVDVAVLLAVLLALTRWSARLRAGRWVVLGTGAALILGLFATAALASVRAPGFASAATVSLAPRDPAGTGADSMELLAGRYVALLGNPDLVARASRLVGVPDLADGTTIETRIDPGTMNLEITVTSDESRLSARSANVLAGLVLTEASSDGLLYARSSATALPTTTRELPSASQVAVLGSLVSVVGALVLGLVLARRQSATSTALTSSASPPKRSQRP